MALIFGALKKDVTAIKLWNILQFFVGGLLFIMIFLLTNKAIQEIRDEKEKKKFQEKSKIYTISNKAMTISYTPRGQKGYKKSTGSLNSLSSNGSSQISNISYLSTGTI